MWLLWIEEKEQDKPDGVLAFMQLNSQVRVMGEQENRHRVLDSGKTCEDSEIRTRNKEGGSRELLI